MTNYTKDQVLDFLREQICNITFTKSNGEVREMQCTLKQEMIPSDKIPKSDSNRTRPKDSSTVTVFDLGINDWRSFNMDRLSSFATA